MPSGDQPHSSPAVPGSVPTSVNTAILPSSSRKPPSGNQASNLPAPCSVASSEPNATALPSGNRNMPPNSKPGRSTVRLRAASRHNRTAGPKSSRNSQDSSKGPPGTSKPINFHPQHLEDALREVIHCLYLNCRSRAVTLAQCGWQQTSTASA